MRIMAFQVCFMQCVSKIGFQQSHDHRWDRIGVAGWVGVMELSFRQSDGRLGGYLCIFHHRRPTCHLSLDTLGSGFF